MAELRKIGNFELLERLGQGGMGTVFKARQVSMDRIVALKVLPPSLAKQTSYTERFVREARASARLSHPNIVGGIDVGQDGGLYYFAMEFVNGPSAKELAAKGKLSEEQVLKIGKAMAEALAHAHGNGILHRDIKPDNILIDKDGTPKLCDLGLARVDSQTEEQKALTQEGTAVGTPHYISPEQARGQRDLDAKTDLYSLGATLYCLLTGKTMFDGSTTTVAIMSKHITDKCPSPVEAGAQASKGLVAMLAKLLAKDRADRYESAQMLAADLERVAHGKPPLHADLPPAKWPFTGAGVPLLPPGKPGTTGAVAPIDKARSTRRESAPEAARGAGRWLVPAGIAGVCVVALVLYLGRGSPQPPEEGARGEKTTPDGAASKTAARVAGPQPVLQKKAALSAEELQRLFDSAQDFSQKNPAGFAAALAEFDKVAAAARGTEFERKARDAIAEISQRRDEAANAAAQAFAEEANALAAQARYDSAIAVWEKIPAEQAELLKARAAKAIADLRAQAEARLKAAADEAAKCLADKRWADAQKAVEAAAQVEYRAWDIYLRDLRTKLAAGEETAAEAARQAASAAAEGVFSRYLGAFVTATLRGDVKAARKTAADAKADAALKDFAPKTQDLSDVCAGLEKAEAAKVAALERLKDGQEHSFETAKGTVKGVVSRVTADEIAIRFQERGVGGERKIRVADLTDTERRRLAGDFNPQSPAEHLAQGIRALVAGDVPTAAVELGDAKSHSLAPPYQAKLDEKLLGAVEGAAKAAWEAIVRDAGTGKLSEAKAKELGDRLAAFEKDHGKTKHAASIAGEMATLKDRLLSAGGGWKFIPPESVRVVLKGQATSSVENGTLVVNTPAGPGNNAQIRLLAFARDFKLQFEYKGDLVEMALRKINWHGTILLLMLPDGFRVRTWLADDPQQQQQSLRVLASLDRQPGFLGTAWHKVEISSVGRALALAMDGKVLCKEDNLPAVARGDAFIWAWPGKTGGKHEYRNIAVAQLDKETSEGTFAGIIMEKNPDFVGFKTDGEDASRRFSPPPAPGGGPDLQVLEPIKRTVTLNRARLSWKLQPDGQPAVVGIKVEPSAPNGALVGAITFLQGACVEVTPDNGPPERFIPVWRPGGPDRTLMQAIAKVKLGDKVKATWTYDDRKRITAIEAAP